MADARGSARARLGEPLWLLAPGLVLALGIGIATALFAVVDTVVWRPLPIEDVDGVVAIWETYAAPGAPRETSEQFSVSHFTFDQWKRRSTAVDTMAALEVGSFNLTGAGEPERLGGAAFSEDMLTVLGVQPALGRGFLPEETRPGGRPVCLVGYSLWQRRFGKDPGLLGQALTVDGIARAVVGILPPGFYHPFDSEIWVPMQVDFARLEERHRTLSSSIPPGS